MIKTIKKYIPKHIKKIGSKCLSYLQNQKDKRLIASQPKKYEKAIEKLRNKKEPIHIVFFAIDTASWKYNSVYQLLKDDPRFKLTVLVCPVINNGEAFRDRNLKECYEDFKKKGYNVIKSFDKEKGKYVNARNLNPDLIFYTNPYKGLVDDRYYITNFLDIPSVYINYGYSTNPYKWGNSLFHRLLWKQYAESGRVKNFIESIQGKKNPAIVITGYPVFDDYIEKNYSDEAWKNKKNEKKRIIWAPHHSIYNVDIKEYIRFSTFLKYADFMKEIVKKYNDKIDFVFKPHPLLKPKLYEHPNWGKEKTDEYYSWWENGETTNYVSGEYRDLFLSSDAMIHDCASFSTEYLYLQKPVMFLSDYNHEEQLNESGLLAYKCHYIGKNSNDIIAFIENVVLAGKDTMKAQRKSFYESDLIPPNGKTVAENIRDNILESIYGEI